MTTIRSIAPAALIAALTLAAAGCGSSGKSEASSSNATTSSGGGYRGYGAASATGTPTHTTATAPAAGVSITATSTKLGTVLAAGPSHMTVYLFEADTATTSACSAECAAVWPPVTGSATAGAGAMSADLGTITRSDGTKQVTYKGHPLYFFASDHAAGDVNGQGIKSFGSAWYVLAPSGDKIDKS
jgi:predicted lipoprotein with Yx(FWY)xxD motif